MKWWHARVPGRRRRAAERDVARELHDHLELEAEAQQQDRIDREAARRAAATIGIAAGVLGTLAAASIPSIRTTRLDPAFVLRE
jgi:hypothetical protein